MFLIFSLFGCGSLLSGVESVDAPERLASLDAEKMGLSARPPEGRVSVSVDIFLTTSGVAREESWSEAEAAELAGGLLSEANGILGRCGILVEPDSVSVVALPRRLMEIEGNEEGSWGGHPPRSVVDPDLFTYRQNERLTSEARELFRFGKRHGEPNSISAFIVEDIRYFVGDEPTGASGLSFPPIAYHHHKDYPHRNSVLLEGMHPGDGGLPFVASRDVLAHEIGHMLLNTGLHKDDAGNLMGEGQGTALTDTQCARMRENTELLYGNRAIVDPGPPNENRP